MKITIKTGVNSDDAEHQEMTINEKKALSVYPLYECPEDAIIGRSLVSCRDVIEFMRLAYAAGKRGEEFVVEEASE